MTLRPSTRYHLQEVAEALGVARSTLSTYRSSGLPKFNPFPQPDGFNSRGAYWLGSTIRAWQSRRPGHGGHPRRAR